MRQPMFRRVTTGGYVEVYSPNHPRAANEMVYEHILVVEKALGKHLPAGAQVHHVNETKTDNGNRNLVACDSAAYHRHLHIRQRALDECGNPNWRKCTYCKVYDDLSNLARKGRINQFCHVACWRADSTAYYAANRANILSLRKERRAPGGVS